MANSIFRSSLTILLLIISGCTRYEYIVVEPANSLPPASGKSSQMLPLTPLEYRLIVVENRLVMQIHNPTDDAIELRTQGSSLVTEDGETHPVRPMPIAPGGFAKLILPPPRPTMERTGPSVTIGAGVSSGGYSRWDPYYGGGYYGEPSSYRVYDANDPYWWDWHGESTIKLTFTYARASETFTHELAIRRQKRK